VKQVFVQEGQFAFENNLRLRTLSNFWPCGARRFWRVEQLEVGLEAGGQVGGLLVVSGFVGPDVSVV
jgi:hypothetical protein